MRKKLLLLENHDCALKKVEEIKVVNAVWNTKTIYHKIKVFHRQEDLRKSRQM